MKKSFLLIFILFLFVNVGYTHAVTKTSLKKGVGLLYSTCGRAQFPPGSEQYVVCKNNLQNALGRLGITWTYIWGFGEPFIDRIGDNIEFIPMIHSVGSSDGGNYSQLEINSIRNFATAHPESYWLIWNEPDLWYTGGSPNRNLIFDFNNDNTINALDTAILAARIYKPLYTAIKNAGQNPKFIIGGLSGVNWNYYQEWPKAFIAEYKRVNNNEYPPLDGWHNHLYRCGDTYINADWRLTITDKMRRWINSQPDGSNKELWLTEFGGCDDSRQITEQLDWMEYYEGIQRYAWFYAGDHVPPYTSNLFNGLSPYDSAFDLSPLGEIYAQYPLNPNFTPIPTPTRTPTPGGPSLTPTPTISTSCICQTSGRCHSSCLLPTLTGGTTYSCSLSSAVSFATAPSAANKNAWCRRASRDTGDADGNGVVNNLDYMYYVRAVNGGTLPPPATLNVNPDINGDGVISPEDRAIIVSHM